MSGEKHKLRNARTARPYFLNKLSKAERASRGFEVEVSRSTVVRMT